MRLGAAHSSRTYARARDAAMGRASGSLAGISGVMGPVFNMLHQQCDPISSKPEAFVAEVGVRPAQSLYAKTGDLFPAPLAVGRTRGGRLPPCDFFLAAAPNTGEWPVRVLADEGRGRFGRTQREATDAVVQAASGPAASMSSCTDHFAMKLFKEWAEVSRGGCA